METKTIDWIKCNNFVHGRFIIGTSHGPLVLFRVNLKCRISVRAI